LTMEKRGTIVGAAVGDCVHVAGLLNFLRLAEEQGYCTFFLGPATSIDELMGAVLEEDPDIVAVSYRLTPEVASKLFEELEAAAQETGLAEKRYVFGGTPPVCRVAEETGFFEAVFSGHADVDEVIAFLHGRQKKEGRVYYPDTLVERIEGKEPYPVIRHHFGLPSLERTVEGVKRIAESGVLDVISIGPDQNAQSAFFHPERMDPTRDGAGGVPVRSRKDFEALYQASRRGNYPLMRCYSGTADVFQMAEILLETIKNAWCAVPLCWYNVLDGRGPRPVRQSIMESQQLMRWHAEKGIPVEVNEAHHWSLRDAHDTIAVVMAYLAAYNARAAGVTHYVAQYMFNTPLGTSPVGDLAKMLAKIELIESLHNENGAGKRFRSYRQVRTGLASLAADMDVAKGQLASSILVQMAVRPHILHVVSFSEADHAATPDDVIEACKIARGVIRNCLYGLPDLTLDPRVRERKEELLAEAKVLLDAVSALGAGKSADPLADPDILARAIEIGLLDAPHLKGNPSARGGLVTKMIDGTCRAVDPSTGRPISEQERIERIFQEPH